MVTVEWPAKPETLSEFLEVLRQALVDTRAYEGCENVQTFLGEVSEKDLINLINSLIDNDPELLLVSCNVLFNSGNEPKQIIIGLLNITRDLLLIST